MRSYTHLACNFFVKLLNTHLFAMFSVTFILQFTVFLIFYFSIVLIDNDWQNLDENNYSNVSKNWAVYTQISCLLQIHSFVSFFIDIIMWHNRQPVNNFQLCIYFYCIRRKKGKWFFISINNNRLQFYESTFCFFKCARYTQLLYIYFS